MECTASSVDHTGAMSQIPGLVFASGRLSIVSEGDDGPREEVGVFRP